MKFERIKVLREGKGCTQAELAEHLHIRQRTYSGYESGKVLIPTRICIELAAYYNTSVDYIIGLTDNPNLCKPIICE